MDRIRQAKSTGLARIPAAGFAENQAWLQVVMIANDLITWTKLIAYQHHPSISGAEIAVFRYMILHTAARITPGARQLILRVDACWRWANEVAHGYTATRDGTLGPQLRPPTVPQPNQLTGWHSGTLTTAPMIEGG